QVRDAAVGVGVVGQHIDVDVLGLGIEHIGRLDEVVARDRGAQRSVLVHLDGDRGRVLQLPVGGAVQDRVGPGLARGLYGDHPVDLVLAVIDLDLGHRSTSSRTTCSGAPSGSVSFSSTGICTSRSGRTSTVSSTAWGGWLTAFGCATPTSTSPMPTAPLRSIT